MCSDGARRRRRSADSVATQRWRVLVDRRGVLAGDAGVVASPHAQVSGKTTQLRGVRSTSTVPSGGQMELSALLAAARAPVTVRVATEGHQPRLPAQGALHVHEASRELPAPLVPLHLRVHPLRQGSLRQHRGPPAPHHLVQHRLFRPTPIRSALLPAARPVHSSSSTRHPRPAAFTCSRSRWVNGHRMVRADPPSQLSFDPRCAALTSVDTDSQ